LWLLRFVENWWVLSFFDTKKMKFVSAGKRAAARAPFPGFAMGPGGSPFIL